MVFPSYSCQRVGWDEAKRNQFKYVFALFLLGAELTLHAWRGLVDASGRQVLFGAIDHGTAVDQLIIALPIRD